MIQKIIMLLLALFLFPGCRPETGTDKDPVTAVSEEDKLMNEAVQEARKTVDEFIRALNNPQGGEGNFSIKTRVKDGEQIEHFWLMDIKYEAGKFTGIIDSDPQWVRNVRYGQPWSVDKSEISDWMYFKDGRMIGNRTLQAMLPQIDPDESKSIKTKSGWN